MLITNIRISTEEISHILQEVRQLVLIGAPKNPDANLSIGTVQEDIAISAQRAGHHLQIRVVIQMGGQHGNFHLNIKMEN